MARVYRTANSRVAHLRGVKREVRSEGEDIESRAKARLSSHRRTGALHIESNRGDTDVVVSLVDEGASVAAAAIEFGWTHPQTGRWVDGLNILRGAAGIAE